MATRKRMTSEANRLATLEAKVVAIESSMAEQSKDIREVRDALVRYKGFWGGLTLISSAIVAFLMIFREALMKKLGFM